MGGAAPVETGKKGKKSLDMELNLVPFIDLLSCLISFLLITAVWTQISAVHAQSTGNLTKDPQTEEPDPNKTSVRVMLTRSGFAMQIAGKDEAIPLATIKSGQTTPGGYDMKALADRLLAVKKQFTQQKAVTVTAEDDVSYEDLIGTIDVLTALQLDEVSVTPK